MAYLDTVKDEAFEDVAAAVNRLRRGESPNADPAFLPTGAQFCVEVGVHRSARLGRVKASKPGSNVVGILPATHFQNKWKA
jgi:hypothetical protein